MEIKRDLEKLVVTRRRFVIRQSPLVEQKACSECGEPMLASGQAAAFFRITQRRIFQIVESNHCHYAETETGAAMICLTSLANFLEAK